MERVGMGLVSDSADVTRWVEAARAGDRDAFRSLVREFLPKVRRYVHRMGCRSSEEDVVQESFLKAWAKLPTLREARGFRS